MSRRVGWAACRLAEWQGGDQRAETWPGALALCLGVGNHGEAGRRCKEGER